MEPEATMPHDHGVTPPGKGDRQEPDSVETLSATKLQKQKRSTHHTHSGGGESAAKSGHAPAATGAGDVSSSPPQSPSGGAMQHDHAGHRADEGGAGETQQQRTVRSSAVLYQQYQSLYEKFKVLDEKYGTLKKAMNEVLWEVLPKYTEEYNQLPALDKTIDDSHIHSSAGSELAGKYSVMENIGEGRFAQVRNCRTVKQADEDDEEGEARVESPMCIKTLNKAMIKDARRGRRVHQEVFALRTLRHPNVIVLYDVIHTREHVHIITERLEKDLFDYIHRRHGMSEGDMFVLVWQIMAGILHCHSRGIAHRDLKPENILVNYRHVKTPVVKLCDFGLSLEQKEPLMEVEMVGSPGFLPPEILAPGWYDPMRGDVWSIGCILLEMVTDADYFKKVWMKPYDNLSEPRVFQERMTASLQRLSTDMRLKLTDGLCDLLFGMLTLDFRERPQLQELREQPWVQNNARRYNMALHDPEASDMVLQPPNLERSPSEYSLVSSVTVSSVLSPKVLNRSTSNATFTEKLRTRVDAFTTKKTFRIRAPDMINTGSESGGTSTQVEDSASAGSNDAAGEEHDHAASSSGHTSGEGGEEEGVNGTPGQLGANGQLQHLKTAASSSPKTPKRQGVKPPSFFSRGKAAVTTTPLTTSF